MDELNPRTSSIECTYVRLLSCCPPTTIIMASYGYVAAFVSCIAFGSFAVPIKGKAADSVKVDPLGKIVKIRFPERRALR